MKNQIATLLAAALLLNACQEEPVRVEEKVINNHPEWTNSANIYEVNIRQYTPEGTIAAFDKHIDRLADMGVNILWIMPVQPIGVENRKGGLGSYYSIQDYTAVNPEFGTLEDFQKMVNHAHDKGMHVILDWVANHTSFDHVWTKTHPEFYSKDSTGAISVALDNDGKPTDWTDVADLDYSNPAMRQAMINDMLFWLKNTNIDGFRCDVAGFVPQDFWEEAIPALKKENNHLFMLAEWDEALKHEVFDMTYGWEFHHILNSVASGKELPLKFDEYLAKEDTTFPADAYRMYFTTNHDENSWNGTVFERMGANHKAAFVLCATFQNGMPLIYGGQEVALNHRLAFFDKDTISWDVDSLIGFFYDMLALKTQNSALWNGALGARQHKITTNQESVYAFSRSNDTNSVAVFINFSNAPVSVSYSDGPADGNYKEWFTNSSIDLTSKGELELGANQYMVFVQKK